MPTLSGIPYEELAAPADAATPTRLLRCARSDAHAFAAALRAAREHPSQPGYVAAEIAFRDEATADGAPGTVVVTVNYRKGL